MLPIDLYLYRREKFRQAARSRVVVRAVDRPMTDLIALLIAAIAILWWVT